MSNVSLHKINVSDFSYSSCADQSILTSKNVFASSPRVMHPRIQQNQDIPDTIGHNYIGIELSSEYIQNTNNRINNITQKEIDDFNKEISIHFVTQTYSERKEKKNK